MAFDGLSCCEKGHGHGLLSNFPDIMQLNIITDMISFRFQVLIYALIVSR